MRHPLLLASLVVVALRCSVPPPPTAPPAAAPPPPPVAAPAEERVVGTVRVTASALNVRAEASADAGVVAKVKRGDVLSVVREDGTWLNVRLASGESGWVAARFVSRGGESGKTTTKKSGCDSDYSFIDPPTLAFSDSGAHGIVVVEANVSAKGVVTGTKVVSNSTGDDALELLAQREIKSAKFSPPTRACVPRAFIFTYRRTF